MSSSTRLNTAQTLRPALSQTVRETIELLQLTVLELSQRISDELQNNPVIEEYNEDKHEGTESPGVLSDVSRLLSGDGSAIEGGYDNTEKNNEREDFDYSLNSGYAHRNQKYLEEIVTQKKSLKSHLLEQAGLYARDEEEFILYQKIITTFDDRGFTDITPAKFAVINSLDPDYTASVYVRISLFEPVGCGVAGVRESLTVQVKHYHPDDALLLSLLENCYDLIEKLDFKSAASRMNLEENEVIKIVKKLFNFNPYPGSLFSLADTGYILPDAEIRHVDGELQIFINDELIPDIRINSYYSGLLDSKSIDPAGREYLEEKISSASALIGNIANWKNTFKMVLTVIAGKQKEFFIKGPGYLKPLIQSDVAGELGFHESTVGRTIRNKYIQTAWGVFELKTFFVSKIESFSSEDGTQHRSSDYLVGMINALIKDENRLEPLNDEKIAEELKKLNINISRRTVVKYREKMNIPSSLKRKKIYIIQKEENQ